MPLRPGTTQATSVLVADPLGTKTVLEQLKSRRGGFAESGSSAVVSLFGDAQKLKSSLDAIKRQVAGHRAQGLKLVEDGGNPDRRLDAGPRNTPRYSPRSQAGDPDAAARSWTRPRRRCQEAAGHDRESPEGKGVLPARSAGSGTRDRAPAHGIAPSRVVSKRPRARVCPVVLASGRAQPRPGTVAAGYLRSSGPGGRRGRDQRRGKSISGAAAMLEELARQQQIVLRLMSGLGEQLTAFDRRAERVPQAQRRPGRARAAGRRA